MFSASHSDVMFHERLKTWFIFQNHERRQKREENAVAKDALLPQQNIKNRPYLRLLSLFYLTDACETIETSLICDWVRKYLCVFFANSTLCLSSAAYFVAVN